MVKMGQIYKITIIYGFILAQPRGKINRIWQLSHIFRQLFTVYQLLVHHNVAAGLFCAQQIAAHPTAVAADGVAGGIF